VLGAASECFLRGVSAGNPRIEECCGGGQRRGHDGCVRVLFATAELAPVAAVGGLAQAASGLTAELRRQGIDVTVVMPDYGGIELADAITTKLAVPAWAGPARVRSGVHPVAGPLSLVETPGLARSHPYLQPDGHGWPDNDRRFLSFARAIAAMVHVERPDVVHLNDWHTGTALAALDGSVPSVLSLHNLAYQGFTDGAWLRHLGQRARHYEWFGGTNPLSGAIALADAVVAVSPTYASEILTPEGGFGLDGALRHRWEAVSGILNGIDTNVWDPAADPALSATYSASQRTTERAAARLANRAAVRLRAGFADDDVLLGVAVTRLTGQKGADLLVPIVPILRSIPLRVVVLGSGEAPIAAALHEAAAAHPDSFAFVEGYDEELSHLLFGAGDLYLMPSRFEPCGLAQMQAMRYGAIPVVTDVGGLHDTVVDVDSDRDGNGFRAPEATSVAFVSALFRGVRNLATARRRGALVRRVMTLDWSWSRPARQYVDLYESVAGG
jgi:starch synthase